MQLQAIGIKSFIILFILIAVGPIVAGLVLQRQIGTFNHIVFWSILAISALTFGIIGISMLNRSVILKDGFLTTESSFYSITIPLANITSVDLIITGSTDDLVGIRLNGIGLPGFRSGWFNSKAGDRLFVDKVEGEYLLISVDGKPRLALQFGNNEAAAKILTSNIHDLRKSGLGKAFAP